METVFGIYALVGLVSAYVWTLRKRRADALMLLLPVSVCAALIGGVAALAPDRFHAWMQEDAWAEWSTAFAFAAAGVVVALGLVRRIQHPQSSSTIEWCVRISLFCLALFCLFVAGEEISWAQRLLAFQPPEVFLENNYQQELNVHNFLNGEEALGVKLDSRYLVALIAIGYGMVAPLSRTAFEGTRLRGYLDAVSPSWLLSPLFAAVAYFELTYPISLTGEACELMLGLLFLADAVHRSGGATRRWNRTRNSRRDPVAGPLLAVVSVVVLGVLTPAATHALVFVPDEKLEAQAHQELELLRMDLEGGAIAERTRGKSRVHKRLFTAAQGGRYVAFGYRSLFLGGRPTPAEPGLADPRRDRKGYFLDPWKSPYWIYASREQDQVAVYSFGPNRKRDTVLDPGSSDGFGGDDIGITLSLTGVNR